MISCDLAVTSAHCIPQGQGDGSSTSGYVLSNGGALKGGGGWKVVEARRFDGAVGQIDTWRDLALVRVDLNSPAVKRDAAAHPYPALAAPDSSAAGDAATAVGFGYANEQCEPEPDEAETPNGYEQAHRRYGDLTIIGLDDGRITCGNLDGVHTAPHDSGGPLFLRIEASPSQEILGVLSGDNRASDTQCNGTESYYVNVTEPVKRAWILEQTAALSRDDDGDGIPLGCDLCPTSSDHTDADGDLVPDDCEDCPCSPTETDPRASGDLDGVCICDAQLPGCYDYCQGHPTDNCPSVSNEDQANCNGDAEIATGAEILGDECDPVPCPAGEAVVLVTSVSKLDMGQVHIRFHHTEVDSLHVEKVVPVDLVILPDTNYAITGVAADYRYCNKSFDSEHVDCFRQNATVIRDALLNAAPSADQELASHTWRRVSIGGLGVDDRDFGMDARRYVTCFGSGTKDLDPLCLPYDRTWQWEPDLARWGLPRTQPDLPSPLLVGRFWFHIESPAGTADGAHGVHHQAGSSLPGESLTNHYIPLLPEDTTITTWSEGNSWYPYFWFQHCPMCDAIATPWDWRVDESVLLAPMGPGYPDRYGVLTRDGSLQEVTDRFGQGLLASLGDSSLIWASPAEPSPMMGRGMGAPLAVAVSSDGTAVLETIRSDGNRMLGIRDRERSGTGAVASSTLTSGGSPPPRTGHAVVYARSSERVFVVGGNDPATGVPRGDIWMHSLVSKSWVPVHAGGYAPNRVLSATFAFGDRRLWVLDEQRQGWLRVRRLVRIDLETGQVDQVGAWPTLGLFDRQWLLVDRDGAAVLVASSSLLRKHVLLRLVVEAGNVRLDGLHAGQWDLVGAPAIDTRGIWLVRHPSKKDGARVQRLDAIERVHAGWHEVASCLR